MVREWDILFCRAEGLNDVDLMGNINQTLCYFCIINFVNLSCQKGIIDYLQSRQK